MDIEFTPRIGLEFESLDNAHQFWTNYGARMGFNVKKHNFTYSKRDKSIITCYRYACSKQGVVRAPDKRDFKTKYPRAETRTDCKAKMTVKLVNGKWRVTKFVGEHNHPLHSKESVHLLRSQRKISKSQGTEIEITNDAGLKQKDTFNLMSRQVGGRVNLGFTRDDVKSYLKCKRQREMEYGEAGCLLQYFQQQLAENPSFFHAYQMDFDEKITNVFWADPQMLINYACFGDVVSFDTTYCTNRQNRPLAIFSGFNHYRSGVIFGATLLYDETIDSFKWLFETFLQAYKQKRPYTFFTDQDQAMARALQDVMPEVKHGLCIFHLHRNGIKHLGNLIKDGSHFIKDLNKCLYNYDEESEFEDAWGKLFQLTI